MPRLPGIDLARGFAFLGMVIVNYRIVVAWGTFGDRGWWLPDFLNLFTSRAAPLFVTIAGIGTTLLYRARRRKHAEGIRTGLGTAVVRAAALGVTLGLLALCVGYNRWTADADHPTIKPAGAITGYIEGNPKVTEALPERVDAYLGSLWSGDVDLMPWLLGALATTLALVVVLRNDPRGSLIARAAFLAVLGYAWVPIWEGDILHWYGLFLLAGAVLVAMPWWIVLPTGLATLCVGPYWRVVNDWAPRAGWRGFDVPAFWEFEDQARNFFYNGWHPVFPWIAFFIAGLLIGRARLDRRYTQVGLLLAGLVLFVGSKQLMPAVRHGFEDEARGRIAAAAQILHHEVPEALRVVQGPESERPFFDEDHRPTAGPKVTTSVASGLDEKKQAGLARSARRIARALSNVRGRPPYANWDVSVEPHPVAGRDGVALVLDLAYEADADVPGNHIEHRDHALAVVADLMSDKGSMRSRFSRGLLRWPRQVDGMGVRRTLTVEDKGTGARRAIPIDTVWLDVTKVRTADDDFAVLATLTSASSGPPPSLFFFPVAMGSSLIALALCLLFARLALIRKVFHPVICAGQMALTLYVAHVLIGLTVIEALGYDLTNDLAGISTCIVTCWLISLGFAMWWRSFARQGPLEAVMRSVCH